MPSFKKMFGTDKKLEKDGVWHDLGSGVRIRVARIGTPEYLQTVRKLAQPHSSLAKRIADDTAVVDDNDLKIFRSIEAKALAKHVLVDWEGITESDEPNSKPVPYSEEAAEAYITDSDDFRKLLVELGNKPANFKAEAEGN